MLLIKSVERFHIGSHFSLRKWRWRPHFPTKLAAAASFSYKIGDCDLIFLQNWQRQLHFITKLAAAASFSYKMGGGSKDLATLASVGVTPRTS